MVFLKKVYWRLCFLVSQNFTGVKNDVKLLYNYLTRRYYIYNNNSTPVLKDNVRKQRNILRKHQIPGSWNKSSRSLCSVGWLACLLLS